MNEANSALVAIARHLGIDHLVIEVEQLMTIVEAIADARHHVERSGRAPRHCIEGLEQAMAVLTEVHLSTVSEYIARQRLQLND